MTAVVLEPHNDDAVLFSSFNAIRHQAHIVTVLRSERQLDLIGVPAYVRENESERAALALGCTWSQWDIGDDGPDWARVEDRLERLDRRMSPDLVFAPWREPGGPGHADHDRVHDLALRIFGVARCRFYTTYAGEGGPRQTGTVVPFEREWVLRKLRALACFESQVLSGPYRFWMMGLEEYTRA